MKKKDYEELETLFKVLLDKSQTKQVIITNIDIIYDLIQAGLVEKVEVE